MAPINKKCAYKGCSSNSKYDSSIRFFHFPQKLPSEWITASGNESLRTLPRSTLKEYRFICEKHFEMTDYRRILSPFKHKPGLRKNVIPKHYVEPSQSNEESKVATLPENTSQSTTVKTPMKTSMKSPAGSTKKTPDRSWLITHNIRSPKTSSIAPAKISMKNPIATSTLMRSKSMSSPWKVTPVKAVAATGTSSAITHTHAPVATPQRVTGSSPVLSVQAAAHQSEDSTQRIKRDSFSWKRFPNARNSADNYAKIASASLLRAPLSVNWQNVEDQLEKTLLYFSKRPVADDASSPPLDLTEEDKATATQFSGNELVGTLFESTEVNNAAAYLSGYVAMRVDRYHRNKKGSTLHDCSVCSGITAHEDLNTHL